MEEKKNDLNMALKKVNYSALDMLEGNFFKSGKRLAASSTLFGVLRELKLSQKKPLAFLLETVSDNAYPFVSIRSKKVGGTVYKIPVHLPLQKRKPLAIKWLIANSCGHKMLSRKASLVKELTLCLKKEGNAIQKKKALHTLAVNNRAYIKYL
jgi:small subunit ribosomal protein S7